MGTGKLEKACFYRRHDSPIIAYQLEGSFTTTSTYINPLMVAFFSCRESPLLKPKGIKEVRASKMVRPPGKKPDKVPLQQ